jgi:hypothetical protein
MISGLALYFTAGSAILRHLVDDYFRRLRLGQSGHAGELAALAIVCDLTAHAIVLSLWGPTVFRAVLILISCLFFLYPLHFLVVTLWGLQAEVRAAVSGELRLNTAFFANVPRRVRSAAEYRPVTVCVAVHTEANEVLFATIRGAQQAVAEYQRTTGQPANLLVADDGLAKWLGGAVTAAGIERVLATAGAPTRAGSLVGAGAGAGAVTGTCSLTGAGSLSGQPTVQLADPLSDQPTDRSAVKLAAQRLAFYRRQGIAFVARPLAGRPGKFKKAGNLNYTNAVAWHLASGASAEQLFSPGGPFAGGYAEGEIVVHELICQLDKDSGIAPGVLSATTPEFAADRSLAFTQHQTVAANPHENYFTWLQARFTGLIYQVAVAGKALQGLQVHMMGHSLFIRRDFLESIGGWPTNKVSEDYATALAGYDAGWHGKYIAFPGLDFTEQVCAGFTEETGKQTRYCYGMSEVVLMRRRQLAWPIRVDLIIHYFSYLNLAAALPLVLLVLALHQLYYLFAGLVVNTVIFLVLPVIQVRALGPSLGFKGSGQAFAFFALNALSFVGHAYSMASGLVAFIADRLRGTYEPFNATSVDRLEHSFSAGLTLLRRYARRNWPALVIYLAIALGCVSVLRDQPPHIIRPLLVAFVAGHVIAPVVLTPQLFARWLPDGRARSARLLPVPWPPMPSLAPSLVSRSR